jgi:hypothetical protein
MKTLAYTNSYKLTEQVYKGESIYNIINLKTESHWANVKDIALAFKWLQKATKLNEENNINFRKMRR